VLSSLQIQISTRQQDRTYEGRTQNKPDLTKHQTVKHQQTPTFASKVIDRIQLHNDYQLQAIR
jgi:hypothetical protein